MKPCYDATKRRLVYCLSTDTLEEAARLMRYEESNFVPVIDNQESKRLIGAIRDRDIASKIISEGRQAKWAKVKDVMQPIWPACYVESLHHK